MPVTMRRKQRTAYNSKQLGKHVPAGCHANATWTNTIKERAPIVHPDVGESGIVVVYNVTSAAGKSVRRRLAENMADVRARYNQQCAAARPHLERCTVPSNGTIMSLYLALHCSLRVETDLSFVLVFKF